MAKQSPNTFRQALVVAQREWKHPRQNWAGYCQKFVRTTYGIPSLYASAYAQWLGADAEDRHVGGKPGDAPVGSALCFKGSGPYGHIVLAAQPFKDGRSGAWSNDLVRYGKIDKVVRTAATTQWGQKYLGYLTAVNGYDLKLKAAPARRPAPAAPKQNKRYEGIKVAIGNLEAARANAAKQKDTADVRALDGEIRQLKAYYDKLRRR